MKLLAFILMLCICITAAGDEGMWMPHQMNSLNLQEKGLEMNPDDLYKKDGTGLMSAIVSLGGGTGEFVSSEGLILTNHHVAYGAIQRASDAEHDYLANGFTAWSHEEEIPASGYIADVLLGYKEVTKSIWKAVKKGMTLEERYEAIDRKIKELVAKEEAKGEDLWAEVASMYSGNQYYLFTYKRLKDIRLVYAPPEDLGNFGGEIDNWMWPRHTCDFSYLRAYVSKDNMGVPYSPENVPYQPKSIVKIAKEGVAAGDFTFVMGYPGRTYRNFALSELEFDIEKMEDSIVERLYAIAFFEDASKKDRETYIRYAGKVKSLHNGLKNYRGKLEGFQKANLIEKKRKAEEDFINWIEADPKRVKLVDGALEKLDAFMSEYKLLYRRQQRYNHLVGRRLGPSMIQQAYTIFRVAVEKQKSDMERDAYYQERNMNRLRSRIRTAERGYVFDVDKAYFKYLLNVSLDSEDDVPEVFDGLSGTSKDAIESYVDDLYANTTLANANVRLSYLDKTPEELLALNDPLIDLAARFEERMAELREEEDKFDQEKLEIKKPYMKLLLEYTNDQIAPDANSTIRFTYGNVEGYRPADAVRYLPITTLKGVIQKDKGEVPFHVPDKIKVLHEAKDFGPYAPEEFGDVPTCFLNTTNVTG